MDEQEFQRLLDLFPVVRSRDYQAEIGSLRPSTSQSGQDEKLEEWQDSWSDGDKNENANQGIDLQDAFWEKLKFAAEKKVGAMEAERFCKAFQQIHNKLVYEDLSSDAAKNLLKMSKKYC